VPYGWTCQFRDRIDFAGFFGIAPPETLSGSERDRKSRAHARFSSDSPRCAKTEGLNGGAEGCHIRAKRLAKTAYIFNNCRELPPNLPPSFVGYPNLLLMAIRQLEVASVSIPSIKTISHSRIAETIEMEVLQL